MRFTEKVILREILLVTDPCKIRNFRRWTSIIPQPCILAVTAPRKWMSKYKNIFLIVYGYNLQIRKEYLLPWIFQVRLQTVPNLKVSVTLMDRWWNFLWIFETSRLQKSRLQNLMWYNLKNLSNTWHNKKYRKRQFFFSISVNSPLVIFLVTRGGSFLGPG